MTVHCTQSLLQSLATDDEKIQPIVSLYFSCQNMFKVLVLLARMGEFDRIQRSYTWVLLACAFCVMEITFRKNYHVARR